MTTTTMITILLLLLKVLSIQLSQLFVMITMIIIIEGEPVVRQERVPMFGGVMPPSSSTANAAQPGLYSSTRFQKRLTSFTHSFIRY